MGCATREADEPLLTFCEDPRKNCLEPGSIYFPDDRRKKDGEENSRDIFRPFNGDLTRRCRLVEYSVECDSMAGLEEER